jgi:hypothetical protein
MSEQQQLAMNLLPPMSNAEHALALHAGEVGGPWPLTGRDPKVLGVLIYHKGAASAIQIKEISAYTKLSDRAVKDAVRSLIVDFKVRIAGSRQEPYGYYLVMTADEAAPRAAPLIHEIELVQARRRAHRQSLHQRAARADAHRDPEGGRVSCQRMIRIQDYLALPQEPRPGQEIPTRMVACGCLVTQRGA